MNVFIQSDRCEQKKFVTWKLQHVGGLPSPHPDSYEHTTEKVKILQEKNAIPVYSRIKQMVK